MKYRHLFFDLDHTLWDFEKNANETLHTLYERHDFARYRTFAVEEFISVYSDMNHALWRMYQNNKISQKQLRERALRAHADEAGRGRSRNSGQYFGRVYGHAAPEIGGVSLHPRGAGLPEAQVPPAPR